MTFLTHFRWSPWNIQENSFIQRTKASIGNGSTHEHSKRDFWNFKSAFYITNLANCFIKRFIWFTVHIRVSNMNKIEWFQYHFSNEYNLVMKFKILLLIHLSLSQLDRHQKLNTTIIFKICFRILWNINLVSKSQILHFLHKLIVCLLSHPSYKAGCFFCSPLFESEGNNERFIVWAVREWYILKQTWNIEKEEC